jgi:hypothetical protein
MIVVIVTVRFTHTITTILQSLSLQPYSNYHYTFTATINTILQILSLQVIVAVRL